MIGVELEALARRCHPSLAGAPLDVRPLRAGGNNRLYRIEGPLGDCVLKLYFRDPAQQRDRLGPEFAFLTYAWGRGLRCVPRPLGRDDEGGAGLYGFLPGRPLSPAEPTAADVDDALAFLRALNATPRAGAALGPAAEACFSVPEHLARVERRVERLEGLPVHDDVSARAARFVADELRPAWRELRARIAARLERGAPRWAGPLAADDRIVSPSDFGFHNALRGEDGRLAFLDFEYAGWDDPAKLVCDFERQPGVPAPREALAAFARGVAELSADPEGTLARVALLRPVAAIAWCCIVLNHFSPLGLARRSFAAPGAAAQRAGQLARARSVLGALAAGLEA